MREVIVLLPAPFVLRVTIEVLRATIEGHRAGAVVRGSNNADSNGDNNGNGDTMLEETLKRYKIEARELTEKLGLNGDISFINNTHEGYIIIEVLIKDGE